MSSTLTTRLALIKPTAGTTEPVNVATQLGDNYDKIDAAVGAFICTSGTRPTGSDRWDGRIIKETDTQKVYVWHAGTSTWIQILTSADVPTVIKAFKTAEPQNNTATMLDDPELILTHSVTGATKWIFDGVIFMQSTAAQDFKMSMIGDTVGVAHSNIRFSISEDSLNEMVFGSNWKNIAIADTGFKRFFISGYYNATGAGFARLQWAQQTAGAGPTKVLTGSWLRAERIA